jgi:hypothetical protein
VGIFSLDESLVLALKFFVYTFALIAGTTSCHIDKAFLEEYAKVVV